MPEDLWRGLGDQRKITQWKLIGEWDGGPALLGFWKNVGRKYPRWVWVQMWTTGKNMAGGRRDLVRSSSGSSVQMRRFTHFLADPPGPPPNDKEIAPLVPAYGTGIVPGSYALIGEPEIEAA